MVFESKYGVARLSKLAFKSTQRGKGAGSTRQIPPHELLFQAGYLSHAGHADFHRETFVSENTDMNSPQQPTRAKVEIPPSPGVFNAHPLMHRMITKLSSLIRDNFKYTAGASEFRLSPFQSKELWQVSGRWDAIGPELLTFKDRHEKELLFSPTAEEAIVALAKPHIVGKHDLPLRAFQITEKFRDEHRPKHGLLRAREFLMADLYTFDADPQTANNTYEQVSDLMYYIFSGKHPAPSSAWMAPPAIGLPNVVRAAADPGAIGGSTSEEYHVVSSLGEDLLVHCPHCNYGSNIEKASCVVDYSGEDVRELSRAAFLERHADVYETVSTDSGACVYLILPRGHVISKAKYQAASQHRGLGHQAPKQIRGESIQYADFLTHLQDPLTHLPTTVYLDASMGNAHPDLCGLPALDLMRMSAPNQDQAHPSSGLDCRENTSGAKCLCVQCSHGLQVDRSIEVGHSFVLGDRYSSAFSLSLPQESNSSNPASGLQMCCFGIGVTRVLSVMAEVYATEKGFAWPVHLAPYKILIIPIHGTKEAIGAPAGASLKGSQAGNSRSDTQKTEALIDALIKKDASLRDEIVVDDRFKLSNSQRIYDAFLLGVPNIILIGAKTKGDPTRVELAHLSTLGSRSVNESFAAVEMNQVHAALTL